MQNEILQNGINVIVIESVESDGTEWGISFTNSNPDAKDYFEMPNKETAFRLRTYLAELTEYTPIPFDNPLSRPVNKLAGVEQ